MAMVMDDKSLPSPNLHLEKNLSLGILIDQPGLVLSSKKQIELFRPSRVYLVRVKSKFIQTMGYSVEVSVNQSARLARILKHSSPADEYSDLGGEESSGLFEFLASLDAMKRRVLDETSGEEKTKKKATAALNSSDEEDENHKLLKVQVQTFDMLYPEEALYQMENGNLVIYRVDMQSQIYLPMSVQQCYEIFFHQIKAAADHQEVRNEISMDDYIVYSNLVRLGYIVRRHCHKQQQQQPAAAAVPGNTPQDQADLPDFETSPLIRRDELGHLKLSSIMNRLDFIPSLSSSVADLQQKLTKRPASAGFHVLYDIHTPSKTFKKSKPAEPAYQLLTRVAGASRRGIPDLGELVWSQESPSPPPQHNLLYAFVNENGEFSFYNFDFKSLPVINELD